MSHGLLKKLLPLVPITPLYRAWTGSMTLAQHNRAENFESVHPCIGCLWHDELLTAPLMKGSLDFMCVISSSKDGDLPAVVMNAFDFRVVRGSSTRGGTGVLLELINGMTNDGYGVGITVDGPRGPRHKIKPGAIWLAVKSGRPIVPIRTFYSKAKIFRSWDRFQLPLPFTRIDIVFGEPWQPEVDLDSSQAIRNACREFDLRMESIRKPESNA